MMFEGYRLVGVIKRAKHVKNHSCFLSVILVVTASFPFAGEAYLGKVIQFSAVVTFGTECFAMLFPVF